MKASQFSRLALVINGACRARGLVSPAFSTPPRKAIDRSIRLYDNGTAIVSVRIADRSVTDVHHDMVDGVIAANGLVGEHAAEIRRELASSGDDASAPAA